MEEVLADLVAEYDRLDALLDGLDRDAWATAAAVDGWTIRDVVVHLALTEEAVVVSLATTSEEWAKGAGRVDELMHAAVRSDSSEPEAVLDRWRRARRASVAAFASADPQASVPWAAAPLRPRTLATTRLAEHWAHSLDIAAPLGVTLPDTARLRHVAWLGHATLPYAMQLAGLEVEPVVARLTGPGGEAWSFGPAGASRWIAGDAGAFCRVGARRLAASASGLEVSDERAAAALAVLRNYAA